MNKNKKLLIVGSLSLVSASLFSISSSVSYSKRESTTNKNFNNLNNYKFLYKFTEQNLKMDYKIRTLTKTENKTLNYYDAKIKKNDSWGINRHIAVGRTKGYSDGYYTSSNEILKHRPFVGFSNVDNHLNMNLSYKTGTSMIDYESMINKVDEWGWLYKNGTYSIKEDYMSDTSLEDNIFNLNKNLFDNGYYSFLEKKHRINFINSNFDSVFNEAIKLDNGKGFEFKYAFKDGHFDWYNYYVAYMKNFNISYEKEAYLKYIDNRFYNTNIKTNRIIDLFKELKTFCNESNINNDIENICNGKKWIEIESDSMGNINTKIDTLVFKNGISNIEKLNILFNKIFTKKINNFNFEYKYVPLIKPDNKIDISIQLLKVIDVANSNMDMIINLKDFDEDKEHNNLKRSLKETFNSITNDKEILWQQAFSFLFQITKEKQIVLREKETVKFVESDIYKKYSSDSLKAKLQITKSKVPNNYKLSDLNSNTNYYDDKKESVFFKEDEPIKLPDNEDDPDKDKEWYGGKWLIHGPIDINYRSSKSENEIITVNGQKIDVLNLEFNKKLIDNRKNIKDDSRIGLQEGLDKDKFNSTNSVAKNEYVIEIKQFAVGTNNTGEPIKRYKVIYKIVEKPTNQIFKYYGWDPDKNPHQKELITKYILDSKGEIKNDKDGNPIKNPKYDPLLDPTTGTKKQIIWINNSSLSKKIKEKLSFVYPCLPNGNKILDYGIIAEASVLGMGALRNISIDKDIQQASGAKYWKCKIGDFRINNDQTKTLEWTKENDIQLTEIPLTNGTSEFSYMSEEGLWIVFTDIDSSISNVQLVLIDKNNKPENFFTDEIRHAKDNHGIELINKFNKFWNSTNAISEAFYNYLYWEDNISKEEAQKLSYESLLEKYQRFVTWSQRYDLPDIIPAEIQNIDLFSDSFMKWNKLNNLNGNTNTERIEKTIIDYIEFNLKQSAKLSEYFPYQNEWWKVSSNNWFIEEWADQNSKANWLKQAAEVYIFNTKEQKEYKGINFTLRGNGKIANQKRNFNIRNEAWHKYDKEIDLSKLDIKDSFEFKLDKKEFELPNKTIDEVDADYRKAIEQKIKELIIEELNNYYVKHNIEMWLDKDVELRNIEGIVSQLIRGKALNKAVEAEIKGINANLLNVKKISFKNLGDGGKFNLKNLSHVFLEDKLILKETQPNQIIQKVQNFIEEKAKQLNLKYEQDYQIYCIDIVAYWYELVQAYDDPRINKNPEFKKQLLKSLKFINDYKTIVIDNNIINIEFEPTDKILKNKLIKYYEKIKNEIKDDIFNRNLNLNLFEKWVVIMPTKNTEGFAQLKVFNKVEKDYDPSIDDPWVKPIEKKNNPDDKQNRLKSISKKWWFPLVMVISIIGLLIGAIFLTKTLLRKYGWSFGKRARHNKNKKCEKAIVKRKQFLKKEHNKNQKELEKKKNILKN